MKRRWSLLWAARFVAKWEGFLGHAYLDTIASPPVWTIGYGHTHGVRPGQTVTQAEARKLLAADLRDAARAVDQAVTVKLTPRQRIACISAVFNLGPGEILHGSGFITKLNHGDYRPARLAVDFALARLVEARRAIAADDRLLTGAVVDVVGLHRVT
jgi:lysozyme